MKTPKRYQNKPLPMLPEGADVDYNRIEDWCQRAKRKNRVKQLKHTIARLTDELMSEREYRRLMLAAYSRLSQNAENARQENLPCTDAEQQTDRKEQA